MAGAKSWMWIAWPAFMAACALELLVFAGVDPQALAWAGHGTPLPRQAVYTLAFFVFWAVAAGACALTLLLARAVAPTPRGGPWNG